jgi:GNAT superfamily N-acetyltransferase
MAETSRLQHRSWTKDQYMISTDSSLISFKKLNAAFASKDVYWAVPMPETAVQETLQNSLCFGLYDKAAQDLSSPDNDASFVGLARCVTDFTTFLYLTDVYVWPTHQGKGLGKWLVACVQEVVEDMPYLRRSMLFTSDWERSVPFYEKLMEMEVLGSERGKGMAVMQRKGPGFPTSL